MIDLSKVKRSADQTRLSELGLDPGEIVQCLQSSPFGGPRIYRIGDSVFSIERALAENIEISLPKGGHPF